MFRCKAGKWISIVLIYMFLMGLTVCDNEQPSGLLHKTIRGTIISYQETENGLIAVLDVENRSSDLQGRFSEETMWFGNDALRDRIAARETGIFVTVISEYPSHNFDMIYPMTGISEGWTN